MEEPASPDFPRIHPAPPAPPARRPGQGLAWTGQGCASQARNSKVPQKPPFCHQMGRRKRSRDGLDGKFDQNFTPDRSRGVPGVISRLFLDNFWTQNPEKVKNLKKKGFRLQDYQQNLEKSQIWDFLMKMKPKWVWIVQFGIRYHQSGAKSPPESIGIPPAP